MHPAPLPSSKDSERYTISESEVNCSQQNRIVQKKHYFIRYYQQSDFVSVYF